MKIWITGIAGFLGSHLCETLINEGHEVWGNDSFICGDKENLHPKAKYPLQGSEPMAVDCADFETMKHCLVLAKPEVLVHCAATAHEGLSSFSPSFITKNIYEASVATFSAAIASGVKRIVYMSSMSRYGEGYAPEGLYPFEGPPFEEHYTPSPVDPYGVAKVAAEDTLRILCETHGVKYSILVPHNIIGIRQRSVDPFRNVASIMINRCKSGKPPIIYGDGSQLRCFSPVADCLPSIVQAVHGAVDGEVVNIGPDKGEISIKELAEKIIKITGFDGYPVYMDARPNEVRQAYCSSDKARRLLGYEPKQSIDDCLKEMVEFIKPEPFSYDFPLEINSELCPKTWRERLM